VDQRSRFIVSSSVRTCLPLSQSRRLHWAIEWVHGDGVSHIAEIREDTPLYRSYTPVFYKHNGESKKRKRENESGLNGKSANKADSSELVAEHVEVSDGNISPAPTVAGNVSTELSTVDTPSTQIKMDDVKSEQVELRRGTADDLGNYFYLVKPHTSGAQKVLIPLSPTDGLQDCLRNQVVLEFPTVQVLSHGPDALPPSFILEADYLDKFKKEQDEMQRLVAEVEDAKAGNFKADPGISAAEHMPNASDILATLERDISGTLS
jgi:hypothetical protein